MTNEEKVAALIQWGEENSDKLPKEFKLNEWITVIDSKLAIQRNLTELKIYHEQKKYHSHCKLAYDRLLEIKTWSEQNPSSEKS